MNIEIFITNTQQLHYDLRSRDNPNIKKKDISISTIYQDMASMLSYKPLLLLNYEIVISKY